MSIQSTNTGSDVFKQAGFNVPTFKPNYQANSIKEPIKDSVELSEKKSKNKKTLIALVGIGGAVALIGGAIYAFKTGKLKGISKKTEGGVQDISAQAEKAINQTVEDAKEKAQVQDISAQAEKAINQTVEDAKEKAQDICDLSKKNLLKVLSEEEEKYTTTYQHLEDKMKEAQDFFVGTKKPEEGRSIEISRLARTVDEYDKNNKLIRHIQFEHAADKPIEITEYHDNLLDSLTYDYARDMNGRFLNYKPAGLYVNVDKGTDNAELALLSLEDGNWKKIIQ